MNPSLSVIVPLFNEATQLPDLLAHLLPFQRAGSEVILVDGGSRDGSAELAAAAGFTVLRTDCGRALQMNKGAEKATGGVLLFLHADTRLPEDALQHVAASLVQRGFDWGRFDVCITGRPAMLRVVAHLMNWRSRLSGIATGDQAIFVRRAVFERVGGFPVQPLMEDVEMSKRLLAFSRPACIAQCATTSGRRWESRGVWRTILLMWRLRWAYWRGTEAAELARRYR